MVLGRNYRSFYPHPTDSVEELITASQTVITHSPYSKYLHPCDTSLMPQVHGWPWDLEQWHWGLREDLYTVCWEIEMWQIRPGFQPSTSGCGQLAELPGLLWLVELSPVGLHPSLINGTTVAEWYKASAGTLILLINSEVRVCVSCGPWLAVGRWFSPGTSAFLHLKTGMSLNDLIVLIGSNTIMLEN